MLQLYIYGEHYHQIYHTYLMYCNSFQPLLATITSPVTDSHPVCPQVPQPGSCSILPFTVSCLFPTLVPDIVVWPEVSGTPSTTHHDGRQDDCREPTSPTALPRFSWDGFPRLNRTIGPLDVHSLEGNIQSGLIISGLRQNFAHTLPVLLWRISKRDTNTNIIVLLNMQLCALLFKLWNKKWLLTDGMQYFSII